MVRWSEGEYELHLAKRGGTKGVAKPSKYRNQKTERDGITFDSKREADRYSDLCLLERSGKIRNLRTQYVFPVVIDGVRVCDYLADFVYDELQAGTWVRVIEDAKGYRNETYRIKKKLMRAVHGIIIRET